MLLVSCDSKYLFSINGSRLNVHSVLSGEIVYRLSYTSSNSSSAATLAPSSSSAVGDSFINTISLNPHNKYQLLSYHQSGAVCLWDYEDGLLIKSFDSKLEIKKVITIDSNVYAVGRLLSPFSGSQSSSEKYSLYKLLLKDLLKSKSNIVEHELVASNLDIDENKFQVVLNYDVKYVAYIQGKRRLVIKYLKNGASEKTFKSKEELTCLAIHPNEDCIATGTKTGKIIVWYNYLESMSDASVKPTMSILHWHALAVLSLCFSTEGSYLLSGGHECVLVKWMFRSGQKDFKPRLGAPLEQIACSKDNTIYAVRHIDNTIQLIGQNLNIIQTFSGFICPNFRYRYRDEKTKKKLGQQFVKSLYPAGLNYFSRLNCLVTNGKPGHLQFFSHTQDKLLFNLDIVDENYISPENLDRPNVHTEIELVAFNSTNTWMATVERRDDSVNTPEVRLKFWHFDQASNKFTLNTLVRYPHSFEKVNQIKFVPNENRLVSCGNDGCFKSWTLIENRPQVSHSNEPASSQGSGSGMSWIYSTCNGYRDLTPNDVDTVQLDATTSAASDPLERSLDGTLVAVAFNHVVVLWHLSAYSGLEFIDELVNCDPNDPVKQVRFVYDAKNRLNLVAVHKSFINVWRKSDADSSYECVWSHSLGESEVIVLDHPLCLNRTPNELLLAFVESSNTNGATNTRNLLIKIAILETDDRASKLNFTQKITSQNSVGALNCISLSRSVEETTEFGQKKGSKRLEELKKSHFFYCDNRGIIQRVFCGSETKETIIVNEGDELDEDNLWNNRISLAKNITKSSLSTIMEYHKSSMIKSQLGSFNQIGDENKKNFDDNMRKIEMTPAYLLPKVGSFCLQTLKSMFKALNESPSTTIEPSEPGKALLNGFENNKKLLNGDID